MRRRKKLIFLVVAFAVIGMVFFAQSPQVLAKNPKGVLKAAFHWGFSADWFDPAMPTLGQSALPCLMLVHDALVKSMPGELYSPCLAESWNISPDFKVYEFN